MSLLESVPQLNRGYRHPFLFGIHYFGGVGDAPRTLTELAMSRLSAEIRSSDDWTFGRQDPAWREKRFELASGRVWRIQTASSISDIVLSATQINYVLDELDGYAALVDVPNNCQVSCFERIWESRDLLGQAPRQQLLANVNDLALGASVNPLGAPVDLVDPTLFCLVYNNTLVSQLNGRRFQAIPPPLPTDVYTASPNYALLPSNVYVRPDGTVKFLSYINNLHPTSQAELYTHLEALFSRFLPMFEYCLTDLHRNNPLRRRIAGPCRYTVWDEPDPPDHSDDEDGWREYEQTMRDWALNRPISLPDVPTTGYPGGLEHQRHRVSLHGRSVQLIVRISDTVLTPHNPSHSASVWQVEGMGAERIVASGFYCLRLENIANCSINFRMAVSFPTGFSPGDNGATLRTWGLGDGDPCHQNIGSRTIVPGLSMVFPNIYQHRRSELRLENPTQDGRLTFIWFYLIDPEIPPIISTAVVPPQQKEWIRNALNEHLDPRIPTEVIDQIMQHVDWLMTQDEAEKHREGYRAGRDAFIQANDSYHFCIPFDIWNGPGIVH